MQATANHVATAGGSQPALRVDGLGVRYGALVALDGVSWDEVWESREQGLLGSRTVAFIGREAFLRNKRAAGRPKDLADIDALREPD